MRAFLIVACIILAATPAVAQTVTAHFTIPPELADIVTDDENRWIVAQPVEADGNPDTDEWLLRRVAPLDDWYRVVAIRAQGVCRGPWFQVPYSDSEMVVIVAQQHGRDVLTVNSRLRIRGVFVDASALTRTLSLTRVAVVTLDAPSCP